jgi:uncharacterized protein YciI
MKKLIALCILSAPIFGAGNGTMSDSERAFLLEQLELTKKNMLQSISGVSAAQWKFKPAPAVWSVQECAEHIVLAEDYIFNASQGILKSPVVDRMQSSNEQVDRMLVAGVLDRSKKATAPEPITPSGTKFATPADAAAEFTKRRDRSIAYVKTTNDDLRVHAADGPAGKMDAYQFLLLMAAHSGRHTLQIREVEGNADYPKMTATISPKFLVTYTLASGNAQSLTKDQLVVLNQHAAYIAQQVQAGLITWGGRTLDPNDLRGLAVLNASAAQAREFVNHDPAVKAGVFKWTVQPFAEFAESR